MAQTIVMARSYQKKPSEIVGITDSYIAYCFDEAAYHMEMKATDDKGKYKWNIFKWSNEQKQNSNKDFINFVQKHHKVVV